MNKLLSLFVLGLFLAAGTAFSENATSPKGILDGKRIAPERVTFSDTQKAAAKKVKYLIVIVQENWSFDSLYGRFPGASGIDNAKPENYLQVNMMGTPYELLPACINTKTGKAYAQIPSDLQNHPFDLQPFIDTNKISGDLSHEFYLEQYQINGGLMNQFATYSDAGGFALSLDRKSVV